MGRQIKNLWLFLILTSVVLGLAPVLMYQAVIGRVPTVTAAEAKKWLARPDRRPLVVDVRTWDSFEAEHIRGSVNWPFASIYMFRSMADIPEELKGRTLFLICNVGIESAMAVRKLEKLSVKNVYNVKGGLQEWAGAVDRTSPPEFTWFINASGESKAFPYRRTSRFEQWTVCVASFGVKPLYMVLSFILIVIVRRLKSTDMKALWWALLFFLIGEIFCAVNYLFFNEDSLLVEYLHIYGMALTFGLTTYAFLEGLDARVIGLSDPDRKCAALNLCGRCIKYEDAPCGFKRVFLFITPMAAILTFMPLTAVPHTVTYNTTIVGTLYNYSHSYFYQVFETRVAPIIGLLFFVVSFLVLKYARQKPLEWAKVLFSAGMGFWGFSMFRMILFQVYRDDMLWAVCWEEFTELMYVVGIGLVLWVFRRKLFPAT